MPPGCAPRVRCRRPVRRAAGGNARSGSPRMSAFPRQRPRRLRSTPALRRLVAQTSLEPRHLVLPMFVADGIDEPRPIASMPGVVQHTRSTLREAAADAVAAGGGGVAVVGVV